MTIAALIISLLALVVSAMTALALVEVYEGLRQVREATGMHDAPRQLPLPSIGATTAEQGLTAQFPEGFGVLLFVSPGCTTCHTLLTTFGGAVPTWTHVVVTATDAGTAQRVIDDYGLAGQPVTVDAARTLTDQLGVDSTPTAVLVHQDTIARAVTVPSRRVLDELVAEVELGARGVTT